MDDIGSSTTTMYGLTRITIQQWTKHWNPLRETYGFLHVRIPNSISLFAMLGPEFEEQVDGRFTVTNGIPPVVRNMVQNEQEHKATRVELAKLKSDLGHLASFLYFFHLPLFHWPIERIDWHNKPRYNRSPHRVLQPSARNKCNWCWPKQCKTIHMEMKV